MISQDKVDMGFDVRETPKSKSNQNRDIDQNKIQNPYAEKYMMDKKRVVLKDGVTDIIRGIKRKRNFASDNETIKFLCDLEKELTRKQMLKEFATCPDCGVSMSIDHVKKIHQHVDKNVECYGCLERSHKIELGTKVVENAKDKKRLKDDYSEQTDAKDEQSGQSEQKLDGVNTFDDNSNDILEWSPQKRSLWADGKI